MFERARDYSESALSAMGLQPRRTATDYILPALGLFGVGLLVGVGLGLMLAPKPGVELRGDIRRRMRGVGAKLRRSHESRDPREHGEALDDEPEDADVITADPIAR
jgi:hypothetical protein